MSDAGIAAQLTLTKAVLTAEICYETPARPVFGLSPFRPRSAPRICLATCATRVLMTAERMPATRESDCASDGRVRISN